MNHVLRLLLLLIILSPSPAMPQTVTNELIGGDRAVARAQRIYVAMSLRNKRRYNYYLGLEAGKLTRRHVTQQRDIQGHPWAKRKIKPGKKVLTRIAQRKRMLIYSDSDGATLTWRDREIGQRARMHQEGIPTKAHAKNKAQMRAMKLANGKRVGSSPASDAQLDALKRLGIDIATLGDLTWLRAGVIIRDVRRRLAGTQQASRKTDWSIDLPARSFLGVARGERTEIARKLFAKILSDVETGRV